MYRSLVPYRKLQRRILGGLDAQKLSPSGLARRSTELKELIMFPRALIMYREISCLLFPRASGNLCRIVGNAIADSRGLSEVSAAFFVSRMLRALELTFSADILHGKVQKAITSEVNLLRPINKHRRVCSYVKCL